MTDSTMTGSRDADWSSPSSRSTGTGMKDMERPPVLNRTNTGGSYASSAMTERAASVRGNKNRPARLEGLRAQASAEGFHERPRLGTVRTASEPRGPSRYHSNAGGGFDQLRPRVLMTAATPQSRANAPHLQPPLQEAELEDEYSGGLYDMYRTRKSNGGVSSRRNPSRSRSHAHPPEFIEEEMEGEDGSGGGGGNGADDDRGTGGSEAEGDTFVDEGDFEMMSSAATAPQHRRTPSRRPEIRKVRLFIQTAHLSFHIFILCRPTYHPPILVQL